MKLKYIAASMLAAGLVTFSGCVNDLDVFPLDPDVVTSNVAYDSAESYTMALNKIYSVWSLSGQDGDSSSDISELDPGNTVLLRCWFTLQTTPSDEAKNAWGDAWVSSMNTMTWTTAQVEPIEGAYQRAMYIVALVNDFMNNIGNAPAEIPQAQYAAEARFCRALAYYSLMDLFGRPPFITEENYSLSPSQLSRADLFNWIESELTTIYNDLPAKAEYGRAGQAAVDALLSRMYLNAEVYTGTPRYDDCIARCNNIFIAGYDLADNYAELFMADNGENPNANKEIIFPVMADGETTRSYGPGVFVLATRASSPEDGTASGIGSGWAGFRATGNLTRAFEFPSDDESTWTDDNILDKRGIFYGDGKAIDITTSYNTFDTQGWTVLKFVNRNSDGTVGKNATFVDMDFPLFRLGEIYLNYAEALNEASGPVDDVYTYVDLIRKRSGLPGLPGGDQPSVGAYGRV